VKLGELRMRVILELVTETGGSAELQVDLREERTANDTGSDSSLHLEV
jgi:hypothetical protein